MSENCSESDKPVWSCVLDVWSVDGTESRQVYELMRPMPSGSYRYKRGG